MLVGGRWSAKVVLLNTVGLNDWLADNFKGLQLAHQHLQLAYGHYICLHQPSRQHLRLSSRGFGA